MLEADRDTIDKKVSQKSLKLNYKSNLNYEIEELSKLLKESQQKK